MWVYLQHKLIRSYSLGWFLPNVVYSAFSIQECWELECWTWMEFLTVVSGMHCFSKQISTSAVPILLWDKITLCGYKISTSLQWHIFNCTGVSDWNYWAHRGSTIVLWTGYKCVWFCVTSWHKWLQKKIVFVWVGLTKRKSRHSVVFLKDNWWIHERRKLGMQIRTQLNGKWQCKFILLC